MEKMVERFREECEARKEERVKREISKAEAERDLVNLEESCWQDLKKTRQEVKEEFPGEDVLEADIEEKLARAEEELQRHKSVNLLAEEEYADQKKRYDFLLQQKKDLRDSIDATREAIRKIDEESKTQFTAAMTEVNKNLQEVFSILFNGGTAELKLVDPNEPLESGVDIVAQPPGKKVQSLTLLSGGEKTLTSLAFFFALFRYKPTPFCVLDEVDAALDDINLARFLELMKKVRTQTQFILITHNTKTMEVADYIYGTTMAEPNITSLYSIKLEKKEELNTAGKQE
jgi:chromosome segregation protein